MGNVLCEIKNITKSFHGNIALNDISLTIEQGDVVALAGENGAGKSTLLKIMSGAFKPDKGKVIFDGKELPFGKPLDIQNAGVSIIYQEFSLIPHLSVAENIYLKRSASIKNQISKVNWKGMYEDARQVLEELGIGHINPKTIVSDLSVANKQMVEIAKALAAKPKMLLMDEPSATLNAEETDHLFKIVNKLKEQNIAIIYISHRIEEYFRACNKLVVLKDGCLVEQCSLEGLEKNDIIRMMVGRDLSTMFSEKTGTINYDKPLLEVQNLRSSAGTHDVSFKLYPGETLGISGLGGSGRSEMVRAICGLDGGKSDATFINGEKVVIKDIRDAINRGIAYLPEERKTQGLVLPMSVKQNMSYAAIKSFSKGAWVKQNEENAACKAMIDKMNVKCASPNQPVRDLSGGNQQKVVVGKWMLRKPIIYIMDEPTRGIDVGAKKEIYDLINELTKTGAGVLFVSSELPELLGVSDRILVLAHGTITGELDAKDATEEKIMQYAFEEDKKVSEKVV